MIGKEAGDKLIGEKIVGECRTVKGPVLIHKGAHRAQRYVLYGTPRRGSDNQEMVVGRVALLTNPPNER